MGDTIPRCSTYGWTRRKWPRKKNILEEHLHTFLRYYSCEGSRCGKRKHSLGFDSREQSSFLGFTNPDCCLGCQTKRAEGHVLDLFHGRLVQCMVPPMVAVVGKMNLAALTEQVKFLHYSNISKDVLIVL